MNRYSCSFSFALVLAASTTPGVAAAQGLDVVFCEISTSPKSVVPGAVDAGGSPIVTRFKSLEDFAVRQDGLVWMIKGRNLLGSDDENTLVIGSGSSGVMFAQEGQPFAGGLVGEQYDFFDTGDPVSWNAVGDIGFSARAKGGLSSEDEKVVFVDVSSNTHTTVYQESDAAAGLTDNPVGNSGDELFGSSIGSVILLDDGTLAFANTPIQNCHSTRYPAFFRAGTSFRQSGISAVTTFNGADVWDTMTYTECITTPDGAHWFMEGEAEGEPSTSDKILAVDDVVVLQESFAVDGGAGPVLTDVFQTRMVSNGDWISRGDDPNNDDWVVHNGNLVLATGDAVGADQVSDVISAVACSRLGDWAAACKTTGAEATNDVLLVNGVVIAREGDPVDVDGNGVFDDQAFLGRANLTSSTFNPNDLYLTDDLTLWFIATMNDGLGNDHESAAGFGTPDVFIRVRVGPDANNNIAYCFGNATDCPCANGGSGSGGCDNAQGTGGVAVALTSFTPDGLGGGTGTLTGSGFPAATTPTAIGIRAPQPEIPAVAFGDGLRCVSASGLVRFGASFASGGTSTHAINHGAGAGTFFYQLWYRNTPATFCDATAAFNLSNGQRITW